MIFSRVNYFFSFFLFTTFLGSAQTTFLPGDLAVMGYVTDLGNCGLPAESDQISFVTFKDITTFTNFFITDNGWEAVNPGFWGDSEGTLRLSRVGGMIPAGTVITLQCRNTGGTWDYSILSPDNNWVIQNVNVPGGQFNLESGGDQIYFLQGGTWNNQGGGMDQAIYDGEILYGFNTLSTWGADGTTHQSNLHTSVLPCNHNESPNAEFYKYTSPFTNTTQFSWLNLIHDPGSWDAFADCGSYLSTFPIYANGFSIPIHNFVFGASCMPCELCSGDIGSLTFNLPFGFYDVVYTDGTDTFELFGISNLHVEDIVIIDTTTFTILSIMETGGCPFPPNFTSATFNAPHNNPGTHGELIICPDYGIVPLGNYLGPHDPGGTWIPPLDPIFGLYYSSFWGPGKYYYVFQHGSGPNGGCPPDTASVSVYWIDASETVLEIGCDVNGTPTDITDDRMTVTLTFIGEGLSPTYTVTVLYFGVPTGTITPNVGMTGVPTMFTLDPGTATTNNLQLLVQDNLGFLCKYKFPLPAPGYCSDPCDHSMTAFLSGDEDICPNGCPDDPAYIDIEIDGGFDDYTMDFSLSAVGFPTWNFTDIPLEYITQIEVCVSDVPAPTYDPSSGFLVVPQFLTGHELIFTLQNVYDFYGCTAILDNEQLFLTIHTLPPITTTSLSFCRTEALDLDLTEYDLFISPFLDVTWFDGDPYQGGDQINSPTGANLENIVQLWAYVEDDYCGNSIQVPFVIRPVPDLDSIPPIEICSGGTVSLQSIPITDQANSMAMYTFHINTPFDSTTILNTISYQPADSTTIFLHANAALCYDTLAIDINVQDYPDFTLQATPCDLLLNTYSILFTSSADSIYASEGTVVNNPLGQDAINGIPNDSSVIIEILNASGLCNDTFMIVAPNCNCPSIDRPLAPQPSYEICEGSPIPVFTVTVDPGLIANWYNVPSGGVPLLQNSLTFQPASAVSASYYAEALDPLTACYSIRTEIPFIVYSPALLQSVADPVICETATINLNTLVPGVLNGVNGTGSWYNLSNNQPVSGTITPQNGDAWYYLFTSNPGNCVSSDTIVAIVNDLPVLDMYNILCDDNTLTFDLLFTSDAENITSSTGTIIQVPGTDTFSISDIPFDTDIQFNLTNTTTGCTSAFTQFAPDCSCPDLLQQSSDAVCSGDGSVDLNDYAGFGVIGDWQLVSTPAGSNPATLAGSNLQIQNKDAGLYTLRFIRSVILDNCVDTAFLDVTVLTSPFADAGSDFTSCAPDNIILNGNAGGSNVQFSWQTNGLGVIGNPNALNTSYTPVLADFTSGNITFTLTAVDQTGACPSAQETIDVTIDASAYYILDNATQTYCDTSDILVDLDDFITFGTAGGHWFFPAGTGAPITGNSQFNPSDLSGGNYTVYYTTSNANPPCKNDTAGINLIIENCLCPSVALSVPVDALCSASGIQDLNDFLITTEQGTWSIVATPAGGQPAVITGSNFVTSDSDNGIYRLRFTLDDPMAGCDEFAEIDLEVVETPSIQILSVECAEDLQSWEVVILTGAEDVSSNAGTLTSLGGGRYMIDDLTPGSTLQVSVSNGNGLCNASENIDAPDCECTLSIGNLPDDLTICTGETFVFEALVTGAKGDLTQFWIVNGDSLFQSTLQVSQPGTYHFVSFDVLGCKEEHLIDVSFYEEMEPNLTMEDVTCPGDNDGIIVIQSIQGGNSPYFISINGASSEPITSFPYIITDLNAGNYQIQISDGFNCRVDLMAVIQSASSESVDLGPDQTILVGDSIFIDPVLSFSPVSFYWTGDTAILDVNQLSNWISPEVDQSLNLYAIDEKGCLYLDDIKIKVLLTSSIFVPTIFSPNGDGANDLIAPLTDPSITIFEFFEIYSRWGELLYSKTNFTPNQAGFGWDGSFHGKPLSPGVFVYRLKAINKRGSVYNQYGDLTLVR